MSMVEREGDFIVACDVCGEQLEPKMNEKQLTEADKKMEVFNNAMAPIRKSLQRVEKIEFDRRVGSFRATPFVSRTSPVLTTPRPQVRTDQLVVAPRARDDHRRKGRQGS